MRNFPNVLWFQSQNCSKMNNNYGLNHMKLLHNGIFHKWKLSKYRFRETIPKMPGYILMLMQEYLLSFHIVPYTFSYKDWFQHIVRFLISLRTHICVSMCEGSFRSPLNLILSLISPQENVESVFLFALSWWFKCSWKWGWGGGTVWESISLITENADLRVLVQDRIKALPFITCDVEQVT